MYVSKLSRTSTILPFRSFINNNCENINNNDNSNTNSNNNDNNNHIIYNINT